MIVNNFFNRCHLLICLEIMTFVLLFSAVQCECLCLRRDCVSGVHRAILSACLSHLPSVLTAYQSAKLIASRRGVIQGLLNKTEAEESLSVLLSDAHQHTICVHKN